MSKCLISRLSDSGGHRLCRGYYKPASKEDRPSEISHLVFVVHGIGEFGLACFMRIF